MCPVCRAGDTPPHTVPRSYLQLVQLSRKKKEQQHQKMYLGHVLPSKIQISLHICAVRSKSSMGAFWTANDAMFVCAEVLQPSQPNGVMSSMVSLPNFYWAGLVL